MLMMMTLIQELNPNFEDFTGHHQIDKNKKRTSIWKYTNIINWILKKTIVLLLRKHWNIKFYRKKNERNVIITE